MSRRKSGALPIKRGNCVFYHRSSKKRNVTVENKIKSRKTPMFFWKFIEGKKL